MRKSRAKWRPGEPFGSLRELLDYIAAREAAGMRRQDIMIYCPWSRGRSTYVIPTLNGERPTSAMVLLNMAFIIVEQMANHGRLWRAERREETTDAAHTRRVAEEAQGVSRGE